MNIWVDETCQIAGLFRTADETGESPTIRFPPGGGEEVVSLGLFSTGCSSNSIAGHAPSDITSEEIRSRARDHNPVSVLITFKELVTAYKN